MNEFIILIQSILTIIADIVIYIGLVCAVYPWFTMRVTLKKDHACGIRGIRKVVFDDGRGVVYLPDIETRRYIEEYAVFEKDGRRFILCRIDPHISVIRYDIASFDLKGRLLDIQSISERISKSGSTSTVALPAKTAYAQVFVRRADAMKIRSVAPFEYSKLGIAVFFALTVLTTIIAAFVSHNAICEIITIFDRYFIFPSSTGIIILLAFVNGAMVAGLTLLCYKIHLKRRINR